MRARGTVALVAAAALLAGCGVSAPERTSTTPPHSRTTSRAPAPPVDPVLARLGLPPITAASPLPGYLMIADRDNNRLLIVNPGHRIVWRFPASGDLQRFAGPDDAFVSADGRSVTTNEEFSDTITIVSLSRRPRIVWQYGHQGVQGSSPGYLAHPDDAYLLANGLIQVADIINCRVLWLNRAKRIVRAIGTAANCAHDPPRALLDPNGDTPLADGGVMVTEIGGYVDRLSATGKLIWSIRTPTGYPSDAHPLPDGNVLVAGYNTPGRVDVMTPSGRILWTYGPASGPGELVQPSLAAPLPNGMIAVTDDGNQRVVVIDPNTKRIVWQYGHTGTSGSRPGYLLNPDGLDLLP